MPTYVYKFVETGETIEVQQSFDDPTLTETVHPVTGVTMPVKKVFLPVGVTFRGNGFYKTDSRSGAGKSSASGSSSGSSSDSSGSGSSGGSESSSSSTDSSSGSTSGSSSSSSSTSTASSPSSS